MRLTLLRTGYDDAEFLTAGALWATAVCRPHVLFATEKNIWRVWLSMCCSSLTISPLF